MWWWMMTTCRRSISSSILNPASILQKRKLHGANQAAVFPPIWTLELIAYLLEIEFPGTAMFSVAMVSDRKAENPIARLNLLRHIQDDQSVSGDDEEYNNDMPELVYATDEEEDDDNTTPQLIDIAAPPNLNELVQFIPCSMRVEAAA